MINAANPQSVSLAGFQTKQFTHNLKLANKDKKSITLDSVYVTMCNWLLQDSELSNIIKKTSKKTMRHDMLQNITKQILQVSK